MRQSRLGAAFLRLSPLANYEVQITEGVLGDLDGICFSIASHRGEDSEEWMAGFEQVIDSLERFPEHGAVPLPLTELGIDSFRQLSIPPYGILYELTGSRVVVFLIVHTNRGFQPLLQERFLRS